MHPGNTPPLFDGALLAQELADAERSLAAALDAVSHWTTPTGVTDELWLEHTLQDVRFHAVTVRTLQNLIRSLPM